MVPTSHFTEVLLIFFLKNSSAYNKSLLGYLYVGYLDIQNSFWEFVYESKYSTNKILYYSVSSCGCAINWDFRFPKQRVRRLSSDMSLFAAAQWLS